MSKADRPAWNPLPNGETDTGARVTCECGASVPRRFALVFGDENDEIDACRHCATAREYHPHERCGPGVGPL